MFQLDTDEQIIAIIHRHWFVISGRLSILAIFLLPPIAALVLAGAFLAPEFIPAATFLICLYTLVVLLVGFIIWADFYLDMWVITTKRVLDIEQAGLFSRSISEFMLNNVQDVSVSISGFFPTILKYGDIIVQTAGENSFSINNVPRPERIKDVIMKCHEKVCLPAEHTGHIKPSKFTATPN
ncbi:MAG: PH domain-containing protein [Candidatus Niyogibacteria bacterium]|nr:PH domain-containing protein [Candidatus Niyogibacteria bacterium]